MQTGSEEANAAGSDMNLPQEEQHLMFSSQADQRTMDEFLENVITIPSWSHMRNHWDCNAAFNSSNRNNEVGVSSVLGDDQCTMVSDHHTQFVNLGKLEDESPSCSKKRYRDEDQCGNLHLSGLDYGVEKIQIASPQGQTHKSDATAAVAVTPVAGIARPRVRARRGQATDPHSIAERLRRERIAERMKSLQELVPNANKTDKASMLDEIIDYVKFLQLQVKVLSMSRLGGIGGTAASLAAALPCEPSQEANTLTECQVSRLMEEDMGSAMHYLQSKGLCLMPISLATSISTASKETAGTQQAATDDGIDSAIPADNNKNH